MLGLAAVLAITAAVYAPGLAGPLLLDDRPNLAPLAAVASGAMSSWDFVSGAGDATVFRPVSRASFLLDWWLWGDDVRAFKAVNLALHLACGVLVFVLARALLGARFGAEHAAGGALFACAAWLLSPLLVSTVLYTVQRMAILAALFSLAGLACYVHGRLHRRWPMVIVAFALCWPLATLSKENGALLPLLALVIEGWWLARREHGPGGDPMARPARRLLLVLTGVPALALIGVLLAAPGRLLAGYATLDFTLAERLLTEPRVLADYLAQLLLLPGASPLGVLRDDVTASTGLLSPPTTLAALIAWTALAAAALASARAPGWRTAAPLGSGIAFFLAAHGVESSLLPLELYFEHRNYLPAVGVYVALAAGGRALAARPVSRWMPVAAVALVAVFALLTWQRAQIWSDEATLYTHAATTHPRSARAQLGLASVEFSAGRFAEGDAALERAAALMGADARAGVALQRLAAWCIAGRAPPPHAYRNLATAGRIGPDRYTLNALAWMAGAVASGACASLDARRTRDALTALALAPMEGDPQRARLRAEHLARLLRALETSATRTPAAR